MSTRDRLKKYLREKQVSEAVFEDTANLSRGFVSKVGDSIRETNLSKISQSYPDLNIAWLKTGEGNMLKEPIENAPPEEEEPNANYRLVPIVHIDSVGGLHSNNAITDEPQYIEGYVPFVNAREGDKAIYESGNSMIPTIPPGSLIQIRKVESWRDYFGYGNIYVIELTDGRQVTKEVAKYEPDPKNYILCKSHNPDVADEELPRSMIVSVWKVINILINKGW